MIKYVSILLFVLGANSFTVRNNNQFVPFTTPDGRNVDQMLEINNKYGNPTGAWGALDVCPRGSYVAAANAKFFPPENVDEKAVTGLKFYCQNDEHMLQQEITSTIGKQGDFCGMRTCRNGFVTGIRVKTLEYQGLFTDDVAVQDIEMGCNNGEEYVPLIYSGFLSIPDDQTIMIPPKPKAFNNGIWSDWLKCSDGLYFCGLETKFEENKPTSDQVAVVDIRFFCCAKK